MSQAGKRMRCRSCYWYNYNVFSGAYETGSFCGLHGGVTVNPDGPQMRLTRSETPDCGYMCKDVQLSLF